MNPSVTFRSRFLRGSSAICRLLQMHYKFKSISASFQLHASYYRKSRQSTGEQEGAVLANGIIYVSEYSQDGNDVVYALRAQDGSMLWHHAMGQAVYNTPVLNGVKVYVGTADGSGYALRADMGAAEWTHITE